MAVRKLHTSNSLTFYSADISDVLELPFFPGGVKAGFPSPAADHMGEKIDLNKIAIKHPQETFFVEVDGDSMKDAGIHHGDLLVVDRSMPHEDGRIYVCYLDGEYTVKRMRIDKQNQTVWLVAENDAYDPIKVSPEDDFIVWGRVIKVLKDI